MNKNLMDRQSFELLCKESFPIIYRDMYGDMRTTCMHWGFEVGNGWHNLIWDLSEKLEPLAAVQTEGKRMCASQVKSKFASLRFYTDGWATEEMQKLITDAEIASAKICETCGEKGKTCGQGWIYTLCEDCDKKRLEERAKLT